MPPSPGPRLCSGKGQALPLYRTRLGGAGSAQSGHLSLKGQLAPSALLTPSTPCTSAGRAVGQPGGLRARTMLSPVAGLGVHTHGLLTQGLWPGRLCLPKAGVGMQLPFSPAALSQPPPCARPFPPIPGLLASHRGRCLSVKELAWTRVVCRQGWLEGSPRGPREPWNGRGQHLLPLGLPGCLGCSAVASPRAASLCH